MNEIEIAPVRLNEAEAVVDLAGRVWRAHYPGIITPDQIEYMLAQRYRPVLVRQFIARGDLWLAARVAGVLVGFAHGHPLTEEDYKLDKLYVDLDWQRQGIGGKLIDALAARVISQGFSRLVLRVNRQNQNGIHAYLKHGFTVATIHLEDIGNGFIMDDYVMTKELV
ncbi:MAG: GNAT family N-acetyltransferase [Gallionellaceae bacterium]|nr:GNAT family N-acetyltransferase [Gallionellaceae bacterium]